MHTMVLNRGHWTLSLHVVLWTSSELYKLQLFINSSVSYALQTKIHENHGGKYMYLFMITPQAIEIKHQLAATQIEVFAC